MGTPPETLPPAGPRDRNVAPAQIAAAVGALLLILLLVWFFFLRAEDEDIETPAAPAPVTDDESEPEDIEGDAGANENGPVETFEVFAPKDPFDPLISEAAGTGGGDAAAGTTATGDGTTATGDGTTATGDGTTATGDGTGTTTTSTTSGSGGGNNSGGERVGGHRVRVVDVYRQGGSPRAQIQVDGTVYTVDEGERFADNFRLMSASGRCATMLYGDDEFTLCEGEEILK